MSPEMAFKKINQKAARLVANASTLLGKHPLSREVVEHLAWLSTELDHVNVLLGESDLPRALANIEGLSGKIATLDTGAWGALDGGEDYMMPSLREHLASRLWGSAQHMLKSASSVEMGWLGLLDAGQHLDLALAILGGIPRQIRHAASMDTLVFQQVPLDVYEWIAKDMESGYGLDRRRIRARKEKELLANTLPEAPEPPRTPRRM